MKRLFLILLVLALGAARAEARDLKPYAGDPTPPPLQLSDLEGKTHALEDYRGRVILINFWATWCPPCVHELPSMQRLKYKLEGKAFEILAVDMAESEEDVKKFLAEKVKVDFTILMDRDGEALQTWKVFAYPTSFLIGPDGKIRYALFGALEWDSPETIDKISSLLPQ
jgi:thiol-disulfide isomerase/thioredoxin